MGKSKTGVDPSSDADGGLLSKLVRWFDDSEMETMSSRRESERARDFRQGRQWTAEEAAVLRGRRQPVTWNNVIGRKIDLLQGIERRGRTDPKAFPRTPIKDNRADVATQILRYVCDDQRFDVTRSAVYDQMLVEGFGGCEVIVEPSNAPSGGYDVVINHIPWERLFFDPHSQNPGFTDALYLGVVIWMDRSQALLEYPGCADILTETFSSGWSETYADKPRTAWCDSARRRVRVVQMWWKEGRDWNTATLTRGGFLEPPMPSPYEDRNGHRSCPVILRSARVGRENERFGVVRDMIPLQEEINKRHVKLIHSLAVKQVVLEQGAVDDVDELRAQVARPDGVIVKNHGFELQISGDQAEISGQFELLQYTIAQMNVTGPNAAMAGKDPREQSGKAILAQQAGGQLENEPIVDELRQWNHKVMEAVWMRVRQFWTAEKVVRVTDSEQNMQFVSINHPVTLQEELSKMDPAQAQQIAQRMGLAPGDPRLQTVIRTENDLDDIDVDITIEEGPDTPSLAIEQFQQIMQLPPSILAQFPPELIIQASSLRNKDDLVKMLQAHQAQQAQSQQAAQAMQMEMLKAKLSLAQATAADKIAQAHDRQAQTVDRLHGWAMDHAEATQPDPNAYPTYVN